MKYIDGIQPAGAVFGTLLVKDGAAWLFWDDKVMRIKNPTIGDLIKYEVRRRDEQD